MSRKKGLTSLVVVLVMVVFGGIYFYLNSNSQNHITTVEKAQKIFSSDLNDFSLPLVGEWKIATSTNYGSLTVLSRDTASSSVFENTNPTLFVIDRRILSTSTDPVAKAGSAKAYADSIKNNLVPSRFKRNYKNYKLIEDKIFPLKDGATEGYLVGNSFDVVDNGAPASTPAQAMSVSTSSHKSIMQFRTLTLFVIQNGKIYTVSAYSDLKDWDKYKDSFMQMISEFKFK